jgi:hypothetical protein
VNARDALHCLVSTRRDQSNHRGVSFRSPVRHILPIGLRATLCDYKGRLLGNRERGDEETVERAILGLAVAGRQQVQRVNGRGVVAVGLRDVSAPGPHSHILPPSDDLTEHSSSSRLEIGCHIHKRGHSRGVVVRIICVNLEGRTFSGLAQFSWISAQFFYLVFVPLCSGPLNCYRSGSVIKERYQGALSSSLFGSGLAVAGWEKSLIPPSVFFWGKTLDIIVRITEQTCRGQLHTHILQ